MNEETRQEIKQMLKQMLAPIVAGVILLAVMQCAQLMLSVHTDLFRKDQQKRTAEKISSNTTAIEVVGKGVAQSAREAHEERVKFHEIERKLLEEMKAK